MVLIRSKPSNVVERGLLSVRTWTNMYSQDVLMQGNILSVTNSSMALFDNGFGEPDIVGGDGIYSSHLTKYPATGSYSFTISVDDNNNQAVFVTKGEPIVKKPPNAGVST